MKKITPFVALLFAISTFAQNDWKVVKDNLDYDYVFACKEGMYRVRNNNKYGFVNNMGVEIVPVIYDEAKDFSSGYAAVKNASNRWGIIDKTGKWKVKPSYKKLGDILYPGFFEFIDSTSALYGAKDYTENVIVPAQYNDISGSTHFVKTYKNKYSWSSSGTKAQGLYNLKGKELLPPEFDNITLDDGSDIALAKKGIETRIVDVNGNTSGDELKAYELVSLMNNRVLYRDVKSKLYGLLDKSGKIIVEAKYYSVYPQTAEGVYIVITRESAWGKEQSKYGLMDLNGKELISPTYTYLAFFQNGLSAATDENSKKGYINKLGKVVIPIKYETAEAFKSNGLAKVSEKVGTQREDFYINQKGVNVAKSDTDYPSLFDGMGMKKVDSEIKIIDKNKVTKKVDGVTDQWNISDGMFKIKCSNGKYGFADLEGKVVIACEYDNVGFFKEGLAYVSKTVSGKSLYGYITKAGEEILPGQLTEATDFVNGYALVKDTKGEKYFINSKGIRQPLPRQYSEIYGFRDGFAVGKATIDDKTAWVFLDKNLNEAFSAYTSSIYFFNQGTALLVTPEEYQVVDDKFNKKGTIDRSGMDSILMFSEGLLGYKTKDGKKWGFKSETGQVIIEPVFISATKFDEGLSAVLTDKGWGYINKKGVFVIPPQFESASPFNNGMAVVKKGNQYGYVDKTGKMWMEAKYPRITDFENGKAVIKTGIAYKLVKAPW